MDDLTTERTSYSQATLTIDVISFFYAFLYIGLYNQALGDVQSTGARIRCP